MRFLILILIFLPSLSLAKSYWIVQNIGTLTLRAYERDCDLCPGRIILETPMIVGRNELDPKTELSAQTELGFFTISKWNKFYVDNREAYIRWDGRKLPKRGGSRKAWGWQGAFGVYAATLSPRNFQHLHGTIGWPNESARFIEHEKDEMGHLTRVGSKGCTRIDNQAIMFLRNFIPEGSPVIRIYAREIDSSKKTIIAYKTWTYVFYETPDLKTEFPLNYEHRPKIKEANILEVGDYKYKTTPEIQPLVEKSLWDLKKVNGNPYEVSDEFLSGYFNIDTGLLTSTYKAPPSLTIGGQIIPQSYFERSN